jgi:hypothetical protein
MILVWRKTGCNYSHILDFISDYPTGTLQFTSATIILLSGQPSNCWHMLLRNKLDFAFGATLGQRLNADTHSQLLEFQQSLSRSILREDLRAIPSTTLLKNESRLKRTI